jgi:SAM-dependent methyltransferase
MAVVWWATYRRHAHALKADLYLLMDVMEHVKDDQEFLKSLVDVASPGAHFVITVPAFNFLRSAHDIFLGHYRRYTLNDITDVARRAGLVVERRCYYFGSIFPAVAALRISKNVFSKSTSAPSSDMRKFPDIANKLVRAVCRVEESAFILNRAFGLTAFVLATRGS